RLSKTNGLSETGISAINYNETNDILFIGYTNSNIDLLKANHIVNIPDIKRVNISGDKSIYNSYFLLDDIYLSTGLGIIVVDVKKLEIKSTWYISDSGSVVKVNEFAKAGDYYYAATDEGLKSMSIAAGDPADF